MKVTNFFVYLSFVVGFLVLPPLSFANFPQNDFIFHHQEAGLLQTIIENGPKGEVFKDLDGGNYTLYDVENNPELQKLVDNVLLEIINTNVGSEICTQILLGSPNLVRFHLGISQTTSDQVISDKCRSTVDSGWIWSNGEPPQFKLSIHPDRLGKKYSVIVTDSEYWKFDSWTDYRSNRTYLIFRSKEMGNNFHFYFLAQLLAHEMAIYFDSKMWVGSIDWSNIPEFNLVSSGASSMTPELRVAAQAFNNPLIGYVLSYIRAMKVEKAVLNQMVSGLKAKIPPVFSYSVDDYPFFKSTCSRDCLQHYLRTQSFDILKYATPLLILAPHYRSQLLSIFEDPTGTREGQYVNVDAINYVKNTIASMAENYENTDGLSLLVNPLMSAEYFQPESMITNLFSRDLLPRALTVTQSARYRDLSGQWRWFLEYMSQPLMSGTNINMSFGPRPRIRTGVL